MAIKVREESCFGEGKMFPPGFRFHPTDEELVLYHLKKKICRRRIVLDIIAEVEVYQCDPLVLPGSSKLKTGDKQWFFFSPIDRKYRNGGRTNRSNKHGYWKITGNDRIIKSNSRPVGVKKTLVFYRGRAPSKERTDWVIHEYTLHEEELKRCPAMQDSFALCKVFEKSGPGPKNGEQYGATFMEEDWANDDCLGFKSIFDQVSPAKHDNEVVSADATEVDGQGEHPSTDLDEFMNKIADEVALIHPPCIDYECGLEKFGSEEGTRSMLVHNCMREVNVVDKSQSQQYSVQASYDVTQSVTSQFKLHEPPEVTLMPNSRPQEHHVVEEDFVEDFLEMDDLIGPQPTAQDFEKTTKVPENFQFDELDGLNEFDLFQDATMFLNETGIGEQGYISQTYMDSLEMGSGDSTQTSHPCMDPCKAGTCEPFHMSHPGVYHPEPEHEMLNTYTHVPLNDLENEMLSVQQSQLSVVDPFCELWRKDQRCVFTPAEANQVAAIPSTSGVIYDGMSGNHPTVSNQKQSGRQDDSTDSWFSAALWAFVESILLLRPQKVF